MRAGPELSILATPADVADAAADLFAELAAKAIAGHGRFFVALSGGTSPCEMHRRLAAPPRREAVDWGRVEVFFGDERGVPPGDEARNDRAARETLLHHVGIPPENVHPIAAEAIDGDLRYDRTLRDTFAKVNPVGSDRRLRPRFDLIVLGMGTDGHTASLFPGHRALAEAERLACRVTDSPKPPKIRVTLTIPAIKAADAVAFLVTGAEKAPALARVLACDTSLPAALVSPPYGRLVYLVDKAAHGG